MLKEKIQIHEKEDFKKGLFVEDESLIVTKQEITDVIRVLDGLRRKLRKKLDRA